ncbi:MAG: trk/ktr system potassium uptake protein [Clostridia bacterium]|nr:trk/ktr system potassium uptake protein [Clostridia bacterium]
MRITIIGAGKVGFKLAEMLSYRGHDVLVIEQDPERQRIIEEKLDVQTLRANGASPAVLKESGIATTDLLIAVTENDELNIIASLFAKKLGAKRTVARIRNPEYLSCAEIGLDNTLGIDLVINPDYVTAAAIAELVEAPEAIESEYYADGKIQLLELRLPPEAQAVNKKLKELPSPNPYLIVAVQRGEKILIPRGEDRLLAGDLVFVLAPAKQMEHVEHLLGQKRMHVQQVVILGGARTAYYLAQRLRGKKIEIKIIEKDRHQCEILSEKLPQAIIIHGDGSDLSLLEEEDIGQADLFAAVTGDDKVNLLVSLLAKHLGAKKVVAKVGRSDYAGLMEKLGIDVVISPRLLTAAAILKYVMRGEIVSVSLLGQDKAEMIEFIAPQGCRVAGKPLKQINFPRHAIIGAIARGEEVIVPGGNDFIMPGDHVIVFALPEAVANVQNFFGSNR